MSVSLPKQLKQDIQQRAAERNIPVSQLVKEVLEYQIWRRDWEKLQEEFAPAFEKLGIKTDDDVEKYFG